VARIYKVPLHAGFDDFEFEDSDPKTGHEFLCEEDDMRLHGFGSLGVPPPMQVVVNTIPGGDRGTKKTLEMMKDIVIETLKDKKYGAFFRGLAIKITLDAGCKTKDFKCEAKAVHNWVRDNVKWIRDTRGFETLQYPYRTLAFGGGDCDDLSILESALYLSIGFPVRLKAIAANPSRKDQFSHVYLEVDVTGHGNWVAADPTVKTAAFGWESPLSYKQMIMEL